MTGEEEISTAIAKVDGMLERCERLAKKSLTPIKPDLSLPRTKPQPVQVAKRPKQFHETPAPVSWEPQERFEAIRRAGGGYKPLCGFGYGEDVDAAFDECSRAPV